MQDIKHLTSASFHCGILQQQQEEFSPVHQQRTQNKPEASVTRFDEDKKLRLEAMTQFDEASSAESDNTANRTRRAVKTASGPAVHSVSASQDVEVRAMTDSAPGGGVGAIISKFIESLQNIMGQEEFMIATMTKRK
ncbi:MAG: hypothetical protein PW790_09430 [Parvibaculaceae bacterium]|nr:hypothetical protein [Parvibaculaceae bacterium]